MKKTTFNSYVVSILIISALYVLLPMILAGLGELSTAGSYVMSWLCFFILTVVSSKLLLGGKYVRFYSVAFILLTLLGLGHYLWLVDPDYFQGNGGPIDRFWGEYHSVFNCVDKVINDRNRYGLLYFDEGQWEVTHPDIWKIISWPFTFLQNKWLSYSPLNVFASLLASSNVVLLYNNKYPGNAGDVKYVRKLLLYTTAFFPMWLLNGTFWRDPSGVALISIGLSLVTLSDSIFKKTISFFVFALLSFYQRTVYIIIAGVALLWRELQNNKMVVRFFLLPILAIAAILILKFFNDSVSEGYLSGYFTYAAIVYAPLKIVFGLIGPFPWIQFMRVFDGNPIFAYQPADYLLGVFQFGYLICIVANYKKLSFKNLDYSTLMGFGMMFAGFTTSVLHIGYIAEGLFFTLPWFFGQFGYEYRKYFFLSLGFLALLNLFVLVFGISGISALWR